MINRYYQPDSLQEGLELLANIENIEIVAGGTDYFVQNKNASLIYNNPILDIERIQELKTIKYEKDTIAIGAGVTFTELIESSLLANNLPIICQAAKTVGACQIRNRGTLGGNIANASPAADMLPALQVLNAVVELQKKGQSRHIQIADFITGNRKTVREKDEIITRFLVRPVSDTRAAFVKIGRRNALAIARISCACLLKSKNNAIDFIKLSVGAATNVPLQLTSLESFLTGKQITSNLLEKAGEIAAEKVLQITTLRPSSSYKIPVITKLVGETIRMAAKQEEKE